LRWAAASFIYFVCVLFSAAQETEPRTGFRAAIGQNPQTRPPLRPSTDTTRCTGSRAQKQRAISAAVTNAGLARQDSRQAFDALLPSVTYNNSAI